MSPRQHLIAAAERMEREAWEIRRDATGHCGPTSVKEYDIRRAEGLRNEAANLRALAARHTDAWMTKSTEKA